MKKTLFKILFLLLVFHNAYAATYYISPAGNDLSGNGSISNPWKSLYKATSAVKTTGDIIHVFAGTYTETQQCVLAVGVSIEGEGVTSIIKSTLKSDWTALLLASSPEGTNGNQHISHLKFDGQNLSTFWGIQVAGRSNVSINNCTIIDFLDRGVLFGGRNDNKEEPPEIYATGNSFHDNIVLNCAAYNTHNGIYGRGCLNIGGQKGMLIYNNTIIQNQRPKGFNGWPIKVYNNGYLLGCKIYNNTLTKIPFHGSSGGENGWDFCIELFNESGLEIYGNRIQGSIDFNHQTKGDYSYSIWIHDNIIFQPTLNSSFESGIILEFESEGVIIENNKLNNISGCILFYTRDFSFISDVVISNNTFLNIGKKSINGHKGVGIGLYSEGTNNFAVNNFTVHNNTLAAASNNAPYYGIEIAGAASVTDMKITNNSIQEFSIASFCSNPAFVINKLVIENNKLTGNGNNNKPFYIRGTPADYTFKNNLKSKSSSGTNPGYNFKQQLIRPLYYEVKNTGFLEYISFLSIFIFLLLMLKEKVYAYPAGLTYTLICLLFSFEKGLPGVAIINILFTAMLVYGWINWLKRDRRKHRIVRIKYSSKKELLFQLAFFVICYSIIVFTLLYFKNYFKADIIPWADAFICAAVCTGLLMMVAKKVESWYWWFAACITAIPIYFVKHYLLNSAVYLMIIIMTAWGLYAWKKRRVTRKRVSQ